jgi:signal peptidase I
MTEISNTVPVVPVAGEPAGPEAAARGLGGGLRQFRTVLCILLCSMLCYLLLSRFVLMAVEVQGASMSPTLLDGEHYLLYRCTYLVRSPRKGEIVVIRDPEDHGLSVKRIVGLPGEVVEMRTDGLYVNGEKYPEPYLVSKYILTPQNQPTKPLQLPKDGYFVLGDNRYRSADSRIYGPVPREGILGVIDK